MYRLRCALQSFCIDVLTMIRITTLGLTLIIALLGGAAVGALSLRQAIEILVVATLFHCYSYISNDLVDLKIDKTQPSRSDSPLVRDVFKVRPTLAVTVALVPLSFALIALFKAAPLAYATLGISYIGLTIYNLLGKKTRYPLGIDIIQAIGWAALALFGAAIAGSDASFARPVIFVALYVFIYNLYMTGVHGGLRDIANDTQQGVRTTAISLGAHPTSNGVFVSKTLTLYAGIWQVSLNALALAALAFNWLNYDGQSWWIAFVIQVVLVSSSIYLILRLGSLTGDYLNVYRLGLFQILSLLASLIFCFIFYVNGFVFAVLFILCISPIFTKNWNTRLFTEGAPVQTLYNNAAPSSEGNRIRS